MCSVHLWSALGLRFAPFYRCKDTAFFSFAQGLSAAKKQVRVCTIVFPFFFVPNCGEIGDSFWQLGGFVVPLQPFRFAQLA